MPNYETLQSIAKGRYGQDVPGAFRKCMANQAIDVKGNTELNGMATAVWGPGTSQNIQTTEWHQIDMYGLILFNLTVAPAP